MQKGDPANVLLFGMTTLSCVHRRRNEGGVGAESASVEHAVSTAQTATTTQRIQHSCSRLQVRLAEQLLLRLLDQGACLQTGTVVCGGDRNKKLKQKKTKKNMLIL